MILGELRDVVMENVGGGYEGDIVRYINKALLELATEMQVVKRATLKVSNGTANLPADCLAIRNVYYQNQRIYPYAEDDIPAKDIGEPGYWTNNEGQLHLIPALADGEIELAYIEKPLKMNKLKDENPIPDSDEFVIAFSTWKTFLQTNGPTNEAQYWQSETERERAMFRKIDTKRGRRPRNVRHRPYI